MKYFYLLILCFGLVSVSFANSNKSDDKPDENPTNWTTGHSIGLNLSQIGLKNWSAGGDPSISFIFQGSYNAKMVKNKHMWQANMGGEWGMQKIKGDDFVKNADFIEVGTKYGFQIDKVVQDEEGNDLPGKWFLAAGVDARSQFSNTWELDDDDERDYVISKFANPITINYGIGIDYHPCESFSLFMTPVSAKHIIVTDDEIAALNRHGNNFENVANFFGATVIATYDQQVYPKPANRIAEEDGGDPNAVFLSSKIRIFKDYLAGPAKNIDVDWETSIKVKVAKYISASVFTHLIWDYDVDTDTDVDGVQRAVQFKDVIGVGIAYTISGKKPNLNK